MMVSAYASRLRLTLASVTADAGTELEAALDVLGLIASKGKVVTADDEPCRAVAIVARTVAHRARTDGATMGNRDVGNSERQWRMRCNRRTVAAINTQGGDWCLALKANQDSLLSDARACFGKAKKDRPVVRVEETGHGRKETRTGTVVSAKWLAEHHEFPGLKAFGRIGAAREIDGSVTSETRVFALSWMPMPEVLLDTVRAHWAIENALHWQLDVSFREDAARNRKDAGPGNIAVLRRRALDLVRRDTSKGSLSIKLKRAGWDDEVLRKVLSGLAET